MQCNIDARGQRVRIISGVICCAIGLIVGVAAYFRMGLVSWVGVVALFLLISGAFQIYEGKKAWCVARAMGIKTRI